MHDRARLQSDRIGVIGLIVVLVFVGIVIAVRALFGGRSEELPLLPRFTALRLAAAAYEGLMLGLVSRAIRCRSDLARRAWLISTAIEALIPTAALVLVTGRAFMRPCGALGAPAMRGYHHLHQSSRSCIFDRRSASGPAWPQRSDSRP